MDKRECPACRKVITCNRLEVLDDKQIQAQSIAGQLEEAVNGGDLVLAKNLIKELKALNRVLQIEGISLFIRQMKEQMSKSQLAAGGQR